MMMKRCLDRKSETEQHNISKQAREDFTPLSKLDDARKGLLGVWLSPSEDVDVHDVCRFNRAFESGPEESITCSRAIVMKGRFTPAVVEAMAPPIL